MLHKETTPPAGTPVRPGDEILVDITWHVTDWVAPDLHKALDCVYIDHRYVPGLSGGERSTPNDGHFAWRYTVPADVRDGATICDKGFVSGPNGEEDYGREVSNVVCFPVGPPPPPRAPGPTTTTTTSGYQPPEGLRVSQETPPPPAQAPGQQPRHENVLPRTGGGSGGARLAAQALGLALLGGAATRRRSPRRPGPAS